MLRNAWPSLVRNTWPNLVRNSHEVRRRIRGGAEPHYFEAMVDFEDGEFVKDTLVKVADRSYPMENHMRFQFIYDGWSPDDPINPDDELLEELENLD